MFELHKDLAGRTPDGPRIGITDGQRLKCAFVWGEMLQHKTSGLDIGDQHVGQFLRFGTGEESAIHAADDANVLAVRVALIARDPRFLLAWFGLFGLCGLYRSLCDLLRISGILRS